MQPSDSQAPTVEIFSGAYCSFCHRAKALLMRKGVKYVEYDVERPGNRELMAQRLPTARTIPQIFIDGKHVGGCDDLERLESTGQLMPMLGR
jgi:glutaredoxin 3